MRIHRGVRRELSTVSDILCLGLVTLALIASALACRPTERDPPPTPTPTATPASSRLVITSLPVGAEVQLDGRLSGLTPVDLVLAPSTYVINLQLAGYSSVERTVQLGAGQTLTLTETLRDSLAPVVELAGLVASSTVGTWITLHARATDNVAIATIRLLIDGTLQLEHSGEVLEYAWDSGQYTAGAHEFLVEAIDAEGNTGVAVHQVLLTEPPTPTPTQTPTPSPTSTPAVRIYDTDLSIPTYPYAAFLHERLDATNNWRVLWLDRAAYEASRPAPQPREYRAVILENRYLKLVFLPELGGRLYQCVLKSTGQGLFYQNPVIKPSFWGPLARDENWWLAAGGMEWALPVQEHGYDWGTPWTYRTATNQRGATITLTDSAGADRTAAEIKVTLPAESCSFGIEARITNPSSAPRALQFWINAALTLGTTTVSPNTRFVVPSDRAVVHSTGDTSLPAERQMLSWPVHNGRDLSHYGNWRNWLGVFFPEATEGFAGVYNEDTGLGVVRIYPPDQAPGLKLFGFGAEFPARAEYSDDGSHYFELWGGPCRSFWAEDDLTLAAGQSIVWREAWLPFSGLGGLSYANAEAATFVALKDGALALSIASSRVSRSKLSVSWNGVVFHTTEVALNPLRIADLVLPLPTGATVPGELVVELWEDGAPILAFGRTLGQ